MYKKKLVKKFCCIFVDLIKKILALHLIEWGGGKALLNFFCIKKTLIDEPKGRGGSGEVQSKS